MGIGQRLKSIMDYKRLNYSKLGRELGYSDVQIGKIVKGDSIPKYDFIQSLYRFVPNLNLDWLLTGSGSMLKESSESTPTTLNEPKANYGNTPISNKILSLEGKTGSEFQEIAKEVISQFQELDTEHKELSEKYTKILEKNNELWIFVDAVKKEYNIK